MIGTETRTAAGILTLTALRGIGPATAERLAERFALLDGIVEAEPGKLRSVVSAAVAESLHEPAALVNAGEKAQRVLDEAERRGVRVLSVFDTDYPEALRSLSDRPPILFVKGKLPPRRSVACIGTREPSEFGEIVSDRIVEILISANWAIVSGLAIGVDTLSHQAALHHGGRTIAVMAGGLDAIYPRQNAKLADEILDKDGALISEQPFGVPPSPRNLVQRDRLQSGLSVATFVMQTDIKGGSMHTVRYTIQQNRLLFAPVPQGRHAAEPKSQGILAMTQFSATRFADIARAEGDYRRILSERYPNGPVAVPLASKEDYTSMLELLENRLGGDAAQDAPVRPSSPTQMSML
ncbi:DNA-processing protein DprA [Mesorhizobium neociceri]|uniref:DNA-processing protein DprA n=1 Tax=Mesorhizobium neociceri TaxID=1307853 RepID=A0A838BCT7_9HYPH|nr:DNA-processing protein DprA [Mesorhizobium neociceri]MBA1143849.1 DNA-processing protein DprA [Mesorhizobium neociceri]